MVSPVPTKGKRRRKSIYGSYNKREYVIIKSRERPIKPGQFKQNISHDNNQVCEVRIFHMTTNKSMKSKIFHMTTIKSLKSEYFI
jgi:hypothetical protein